MTAPHEPADQTPEHGAAADAAPAAQDDLLAELNELRAQLDAAQATVNEQHDQLLRVRAEAERAPPRPGRRVQGPQVRHRVVRREPGSGQGQPGSRAGPARADRGHPARRRGSDPEAAGRRLRAQPAQEIAPAQGDKFDPHLHQAISSVPADQPANTVLQLLQKGYAIADRTLRPALVVVSAGQG